MQGGNDMTIPHTKTAWVNGGAPGISAEKLNAIEQSVYVATLYGADSGGDDTYVLNLNVGDLSAGVTLAFTVTTGNTGACSLSIDNGSASAAIQKIISTGLTDLETGDIVANQVVVVVWDGTVWQLTGGRSNADMVDLKHASDFQSSAKAYGYVNYNESISASSTSTKNIALGGSYSFGKLTINASLYLGVMIFFCTDNTKTLVTGYAQPSSTNGAGGAWSRRHKGLVTETGDTNVVGTRVTGSQNIRINECYISGTNLVITFQNTDASSATLNTNVDWEVW